MRRRLRGRGAAIRNLIFNAMIVNQFSAAGKSEGRTRAAALTGENDCRLIQKRNFTASCQKRGKFDWRTSNLLIAPNPALLAFRS